MSRVLAGRRDAPGRTATAAMRPAHRTAIVLAGTLAALLWSCWSLLRGNYVLDLNVYLTGGRAVLHGHDLYAADVRIRQYGFTYPPFAALLFAVPALLPVPLDVAVLSVVSIVALGVVVGLSDPARVRALVRGRSLAALPALMVMLACLPVRSTLTNGQINLVLVAMVMVDALWLARSSRGGLLIGLAAAIKLTPALFVLYLVVTGRRRQAGNALAAFVGASALAALLLPGDSVDYWTSQVFGGAAIGDTARVANQSIFAVAQRWVGHDAAVPVWVALAIATVLAGLALALRISSSGREPPALAVVGITSCLVSPVSWQHHWIWFIPWFAGLLVPAATRLHRGFAIVAAVVFDVLSVGVMQALDSWAPVRVIVDNAYVLMAVAAAGYVGAGALVRRRADARPQRRSVSQRRGRAPWPVEPGARSASGSYAQ